MADFDLNISNEAIEHIRKAMDAWRGDNRDLALALTTMGHAMVLSCGGCEAWIMCSQARGELGAWTPHQMGPIALMPYDDALAAVLALYEAQLACALHPVEDDLCIIEARRKVKDCQGGESKPSQVVCGFAQMDQLGREQIEARIMHRWPDQMGQKLGQSLKATGLSDSSSRAEIGMALLAKRNEQELLNITKKFAC